jgi:hypothetical protein
MFSTIPFFITSTSSGGGGGFDPDAQAYINAVIAGGGTLSSPQEEAINTYFVDLKAEGLYSKLYFMHLFLGGTENSNKINAVNPGTYDLGFQGTWTHATTGSSTVQSNSNYATSGFVISASSPSTVETDFAFGVMLSDKDTAMTPYQYMGLGTDASNYMLLGGQWNQYSNGIENYYGGIQTGFSAVGFTGYWNSLSRTSINSVFSAALFNGESVTGGLLTLGPDATTFTPSSTPYDLNLFRIDGLANYPLAGNALFYWAGTSFTIAQMNTFAIKTNTLQTAFSRNIFTV